MEDIHQQNVTATAYALANGALRPNSLEFHDFVHFWSMEQDLVRHKGSLRQDRHYIDNHRALAWPRPHGMPKLDYEGLMAIYHITGFTNWPSGWRHEFPWMMEDLDGRAKPAATHWIILPTPKLETLAAFVLGHKRAARTEAFRLHARPGDPKFDRTVYFRAEHEALMKKLEPYLIRRSNK